MQRMTREELIALVEEIIACEKPEGEILKMVSLLEKNVIDPDVSNYIYWDDLTPQEIIDKALSYKPILL